MVLLGLSFWVARFPHSTVELVAFDDSGREMSAAQFFRTWRPALIVRDLEGSPTLGIQYGLGAIQVAVPANEPVSLEMPWSVPGFGKVLVDADNGGHGYRAASQGRLKIELLPELARSRLGQIERWIAVHNRGTCESNQASSLLESVRLLMRRVDRSKNLAARANFSLLALRFGLQAGEEEVLAEADRDIGIHRRGLISLTALDRKGVPISNLKIKLRQTKFDFLFGVFSENYDNKTIDRLQALGTNYATLHLNWSAIEPSPKKFEFDRLDNSLNVAELEERDFTLRGHALVWLAHGELPAYMDGFTGDVASLDRAVREHVAGLVTHYGNKIAIWEANNEGHAAWARWGLDDEGMLEVINSAASEIRKDDPRASILVNLALPLGEDVALKNYPMMSLISSGRIGERSSDPYLFAKRLIRARVPFDQIGLQFYNGAWVDVFGGVQVPAIDLFRFASELDRYDRLGKPLQITELGVGSEPQHGIGDCYWHRIPDQKTQAEYLAGIFTIAYGHKSVQGINWWDLEDPDAFVKTGGLLDQNFRPKLAFRKLAALLSAWRSEGEVVTGDDGIARFEGAAGEYEITFSDHGRQFTTAAHVRPDETKSVVLRSEFDSRGNLFTDERLRRDRRSADCLVCLPAPHCCTDEGSRP